jgi:hypothetical protein
VTIFVVKAGVALGLAWTSHGGSTLYIETLGGLSSFPPGLFERKLTERRKRKSYKIINEMEGRRKIEVKRLLKGERLREIGN